MHRIWSLSLDSVEYRKVSDDSLSFALRNGVVPFSEIRDTGRGSGLRKADHEFSLGLVEIKVPVKLLSGDVK